MDVAITTVVLALGKGMDIHGTLSKQSVKNTEKAVEFYKACGHCALLFSGGYSFKLGSASEYRESLQMKKLAMGPGVDADNIIVETDSLDTAGNAIYSEHIISKMQGIKKITLVTSPEHMQRAMFFFTLAFRGYEITPCPAVSALSGHELEISYKNEERALVSIKAQFSKFDMDSMKFEDVVKKINPLYACDTKDIPDQAWQYLQGIGFSKERMISEFISKNRKSGGCD
ncbi:MAG: YdcF family protein [Candidatus Marsarchaeota archaeon]|jgi:uncharacterized SAM-binding protein YcdF (DUF218 family)|nr:YdcF family protein [Candidatus Marsarchaeota archaeon]